MWHFIASGRCKNRAWYRDDNEADNNVEQYINDHLPAQETENEVNEDNLDLENDDNDREQNNDDGRNDNNDDGRDYNNDDGRDYNNDDLRDVDEEDEEDYRQSDNDDKATRAAT